MDVYYPQLAAQNLKPTQFVVAQAGNEKNCSTLCHWWIYLCTHTYISTCIACFMYTYECVNQICVTSQCLQIVESYKSQLRYPYCSLLPVLLRFHDAAETWAFSHFVSFHLLQNYRKVNSTEGPSDC